MRTFPSKRVRCWECLCDCGQATVVLQSSLRNGLTMSCGCQQREGARQRFTTHGMSGTSEYHIWEAMIERCGNPNHAAYAAYGGRGIRVCEAWRTDFAAFFRAMGPRPPGLTLERIDNDGHYEPGNVRWATRREQMQNRRGLHLVDGLTLTAFAATHGVSYDRLRWHIRKGATAHAALARIQG